MRNYLFFLGLSLLSLSARAQTERGSKLLGLSAGNFTYTDQAGPDYDLTGALYPSVGWFVVDRLALGAELRLSYDRNRSGYVSVDGPIVRTSRIWGLGLAPFARYYLVDASKHKLFVQASGEYTRFLQRNTTEEVGRQKPYGNSFGYNGSGWSAGAGYNYFVSPNVALEARAGYRRDRQNSFIGIGGQGSLDVRLGFSVFLPSGQTTATP
jgi:hypothetical protein